MIARAAAPPFHAAFAVVLFAGAAACVARAPAVVAPAVARASCAPAAPAPFHDSGGPYFTLETVAKAVVMRTGSPNPSPPSAGALPAVVDVTFIVDTVGRAETATVRVVRSTSPSFERSVLATLPRMQFLPAEQPVGCRVRQQVEQPFLYDVVH